MPSVLSSPLDPTSICSDAWVEALSKSPQSQTPILNSYIGSKRGQFKLGIAIKTTGSLQSEMQLSLPDPIHARMGLIEPFPKLCTGSILCRLLLPWRKTNFIDCFPV